jgi:hypothetical protein
MLQMRTARLLPPSMRDRIINCIGQVGAKTTQGLLQLIRAERNGDTVNRLLLAHLLRMLTALGIYQTAFQVSWSGRALSTLWIVSCVFWVSWINNPMLSVICRMCFWTRHGSTMQQRAPGSCQSWTWQTTCSIARSIVYLSPGKLHCCVATCSSVHPGVAEWYSRTFDAC